MIDPNNVTGLLIQVTGMGFLAGFCWSIFLEWW